MIAVIQRVSAARVIADGELSGESGAGLYILLGVTTTDTEEDARLLSTKIKKLRIFSDENGKMNLSVMDVGGEVTVVSNFTLYANYAHGNRPDYLQSARPEQAEPLYEHFISLMRDDISHVATGKFGADMKTDLVTDGPVTIVMDSAVLRRGK